jgi:flagellar biogenesis protein FliO
MRPVRLAIVGVVLLLSATGSFAQATKPVAAVAAVEDPNGDLPLPVRHGGGATTQATLVGGSASATSSDAFDLKRLGMALAMVLAAIYVAHQVWKRLGMPGSVNRSAGALQVVSRLTLAPKQQLLLVRVGRRVVLVGNSGTQMNALCEIGDPEEAAGLLGQAATEREGSVSSTFHEVLGGEEQRFDEETNVDVPVGDADHEAEEEGKELATTREELSGLVEKVRGLSRHFRPDAKGE